MVIWDEDARPMPEDKTRRTGLRLEKTKEEPTARAVSIERRRVSFLWEE